MDFLECGFRDGRQAAWLASAEEAKQDMPMLQSLESAFRAALRSVSIASPNVSEAGRQLPRKHHPIFYGCYDWHSAIHCHWLLVHCLRKYSAYLPRDLKQAAVETLNLHFTEEGAEVECNSLYIEPPGWEMPYGYAWLLVLLQEIREWSGEETPHEHPSFGGPVLMLEAEARCRFFGWVRSLKSANRSGLHDTTAFALLLGLNYARRAPEPGACAGTLERAIVGTIWRLLHSQPADVSLPDFNGFLCPMLVEAQALIAAVPGSGYFDWIKDKLALTPLIDMVPVTSLDPRNPSSCHLIGYNFSVAEGLAEVARVWPDPREASMLLDCAHRHLEASKKHLDSGIFMTDHWVGTFAVLALETISKASKRLATDANSMLDLALPSSRGPAWNPEEIGLTARCDPDAIPVLFFNGKILRPVHGAHVEVRQWLYMEHGAVTRSGLGSPPQDLVDSAEVSKRDLAGKVVLPGLMDAHIHVYAVAKQRRSVNLQGCTSIEQLQDRFRSHLRDRGHLTDPMPFIEGSHWDQDLLGALPTRYDIDAVCPQTPVIIYRRCWHVCVANSAALAACNVSSSTPDVRGGQIDRTQNGEVTGVLREAAMELLQPLTGQELDFEQKKQLLLEGLQLCASMGITAVQTNDSKQLGGLSDPWNVYAALADEGKLPCRVFLTVACQDLGTRGAPQVPVAHLSGLLSCDRVKLWTDGGLGARTAALIEPYADDPGNTGILQMTPGEIDAAVADAKRRNFRVEAHAIGDRAATALLNSFECHLSPIDRPVLTHCQILTPPLIRWMARLGVIANVQPQFVPSDSAIVGERLGVGSERYLHSYAWSTLRRHGVHLAGGSDSPVEEPAPLVGMRCAMTHESSSPCGPPLHRHECLSFGEALEMYTTGAAYAAQAEGLIGGLLEGQEADLVVVDGCQPGRGPMLTAEDLRDAVVDEVWVRGRLVHSRAMASEDAAPPPAMNGMGEGAFPGQEEEY